MTDGDNKLFLGLDSSTQGLKASLMDDSLAVLFDAAVSFDKDLPEFKTEGGAHRQADGLTVTAPPLMWVAALDLVLERLMAKGAPLGHVVAISGSGQQHGSVWLRCGTREVLASLSSDALLRDQLKDIFSVEDSPIWMDASTSAECATLEAALGGAQQVAELTGSRAYERFTGNQIAKIRRTRPDAYEATERIALVSSFMASLLIGNYASIDYSDGSGMNLLNIRTKQWDQAALDCAGDGLSEKLGAPVASHTVVGRIHAYFRQRYGFAEACHVIAFSGDNPNSLAGLRLQQPGDIAISLGTSDTCFGAASEAAPSGEEGHVFVSPTDPDAFMVMIVRQNGSLTRERVRDRCAGGTWAGMEAQMAKHPAGNNGNVGFFFDEPEITPPVQKTGAYRFDADDNGVSEFDDPTEVRALQEGQFLSLRLHAEKIGLRPRSILATGGASVDKDLVQLISNVFGAPVHVGEQSDSASLGAAYRARHGWLCETAGGYVPFSEALGGESPFRDAARPDADAYTAYTAMLPRIEKLEHRVLAAQ